MLAAPPPALSLAGEGALKREQALDRRMLDIFGRDAEHPDPDRLQQPLPFEIIERPSKIIVGAAIDLERPPERGAVEVDDATADDLLPSKLQAQATPITKDLPGHGLRRRRPAAKSSRSHAGCSSICRSWSRQAPGPPNGPSERWRPRSAVQRSGV